MKKKTAISMILLIIFLMSLTFASDANTLISTPEIEQVTDNGWDDFCPVVDVDSAGNPHVVWVSTDGAYYAVKSSDSWSMTKIITDPPITGWIVQHFGPDMVSLRLDSQDRPHIAWAKPSSGHPAGAQVFYSYWNGSKWVTEQVTHWGSGVTQLHKVVLALDSQDQPHIVWDSRVGLWGVFYSEKNGANWTFEVISHYDDANPSIAIDKSDISHVCWQALRNQGAWPGQGLWLASHDGGTWTTEQIVTGRASPSRRGLAIDSLGNPHVVFCCGEEYRLLYGNKSSGSWSITEIANGANLNLYSCIALSANNMPYVAWSSDATGIFDIYVAEYEQQWIVYNTSNQLFDETRPMIAIDAQGNIHLVWYGPELGQGESEIYYAEIAERISATVDIDPGSLNLKSKGEWITAYIELPEGYDVSDINVSTILMNDTIPAEMHPVGIGDEDDDGIPDLMAKFDRVEVTAYILANVNMAQLIEEKFMTVTLTVTGYLNDGKPFRGSDIIKIILCMPRGGLGRHIFPI